MWNFSKIVFDFLTCILCVQEPYCLAEAVHFLEMELTVMRRNLVDALHDVPDSELKTKPKTKGLENSQL
ncbi:hypothetical protein V1264_024201 [Littorina saxatilis]|uniref:Uncharacterized protein n=1 Tax=Littorina saxatilis TaxID=31220 RepID=A0AAN9AKZ3_9CAEN